MHSVTSALNTNRAIFYLLGASGFVGQHLMRKLDPSCLLGTHCTTPTTHTYFYKSGETPFESLFDTGFEAKHAVIMLGDTKIDSCKVNLNASKITNVTGIKKLIDELYYFKIKPVFISSEYVYNGEDGNYTEDVEPNANTIYGQQKAEIEMYLKDSGEDFCVLRFPKVLGVEMGDGTILTSWIKNLEDKVDLKLANDQYFSATHVDDVCEGVVRAVEKNISGIFNLCSPYCYNRIQMIENLGKTIGMKPFFTEHSIIEFDFMDNRPFNVSMNPSKIINAIGLNFNTLEEICHEISENYRSMQK